jgi:hypothetical protein
MPNDLLLEALVGPPRRYWEALGRFITMFSVVEENVQLALWRAAGVKPPVAPAIFSGTRIEAATGHIKRIAEAQKWPKRKRAELAEVFKQLSDLTRIRNDMLHYGASSSGPDEWTVSSRLVAHIAERIRETKISPAILHQMSEDLFKITLHLAGIERRGKPVRVHPSIAPILARAWLYKSQPQPNLNKTRGSQVPRNKRLRRSRQPQSSRA